MESYSSPMLREMGQVFGELPLRGRPSLGTRGIVILDSGTQLTALVVVV